ncbi:MULTISPECIES: ParB/RepB/Spo0J family partition protein [Providencia]|uniref:ParB/RepB/Spo0J family partition protein n=1 Tax=Providencia TaxID=586 RepID=UPI00234A64DA|nr:MULTISPECIES: ParB/RepB/Spo0J family partition protein [Providencia]MDH2371647.1 ParB/RepB/Spo0J family partition protein [Providencia rettgeri]
MSTLETIINPKQRKAKKGTKSAQADAIYQALDSVEAHVLPLSVLVQSELNVRKRPIDEKALSELADSIQAVGVLQNLVVYPMDNDVYGVAAGQRRLLALQQLVTKGHLASSFPVPVKVVSESDVLIISLTENSQREAMHPADQLHAFIELQKTGKNASEIGDLLGFSTHHVKKYLRLANMAPELLAELDADNITLDQLQALAGTPYHDRQVMVWNNAIGWKKEPRYLREAIEETKTSVENNRLVKFVGLDAYEQAGGTLEIDLFTEAGFIENVPLLEKLALDKLTVCAELLADIEGWQFGIARLERPSFYGNDGETLSLSHAPEAVIPPEFADLLAALRAREADLREQALNAEEYHEQIDLWQAVDDCEKQIDGIKDRTQNLAWTADGKATKGVVVYLDRDGESCVIRGVIDLAQQEPQCSEAESETERVSEQSTTTVETVSTYSSALCKSLSSERTLAVQAALTQHPNVALAILVHDACIQVFGSSYAKTAFNIKFSRAQDELLKNVPTAQDSEALIMLETQFESWSVRLPDAWQADFSWLLSWEQTDLVALLAFCSAQTLSEVNHYAPHDNTLAKALRPIEQAIAFDFHQWWQPTKANFFGRISKDQIVDCLDDAGVKGKALEVVKMKKGDAAELAENTLRDTHWLPSCFLDVNAILITPITRNNQHGDTA